MQYRFCPNCATPLVRRSAFGKPRSVCPECGFVHFRDPKVAVIGMVTARSHVLLVRRAVEPAKGYWALPGGYMDAGEMPREALARELMEEVGLETNVGPLLGIFPLVSAGTTGGIVIAFHASPREESLHPLKHDDDIDAAGWFAANELPDKIAFESSARLLGAWKDGLVAGNAPGGPEVMA